jgi:hypothetical protein
MMNKFDLIQSFFVERKQEKQLSNLFIAKILND